MPARSFASLTVRAAAAAALLAPLWLAGCGSSGGNTDGGAGAGAQFCTEWAAVGCRRLWECNPDAASNPLALGSEAACATGWAGTCSNPQPSGTTFTVNCSGGKQVNQAAKTTCLDRLNTVSCADFNDPSYDDGCELVCPL